MALGTFVTAPRAVLWDLDGTLIDSAPHHWRAWQQTMASLHVRMDVEYFANAFGRRNDTIIKGLLGDDASPALIDRIAEEKESRYRGLLRENGLSPLPGAERWLRRLRTDGWRQALATAAPIPNVTAVIEALHWAELFDARVSADEVGKGKPDPTVFLVAAQRIGVDPGRCVVVEDAPAGIEGARRAGMSCIGVRSDHHPELSADLVVDRLDLLPEDAFDRLLDGDRPSPRDRTTATCA